MALYYDNYTQCIRTYLKSYSTIVFVIIFKQSDKLVLSARIMNTSYIPSVPFTLSRLPNMLITLINKTTYSITHLVTFSREYLL